MMIEFPTPDKVPIFNDLAELNPNFSVLYLHRTSAEHGWGDLELRHRHVFVSTQAEAARWVTREIMSGSFDAVVCYGYRTLPYLSAFLAARLKGVPRAIRSDTNVDLVRLDSTTKRLLRKLAMRAIIGKRASAWTIGSKNAEFWLDEVGLVREFRIEYDTPVLPGGFAPRDRHRKLSDPVRVVFVGRLSAEKRIADLIRAVKLLPPGVVWTLTIIGQGPEDAPLHQLAGDDPRITFTGALAQHGVGEVLLRSDVLVLPSSYEAWGLVVNEALGYGVRVLVSDRVGSARDLITAENGDVFPVGDVSALSEKIAASAQFEYQAAKAPRGTSAEEMAQAAVEMASHG